MPTMGFEPTISAGERPQTYALDGAATGTGFQYVLQYKIYKTVKHNKEWLYTNCGCRQVFQMYWPKCKNTGF